MKRRRQSPDNDRHDAIEKFYRFRTCPACRVERMAFMVNRDALKCPDPACGFTLDGKTDRMGEDAILDAVDFHKAMTNPKEPEPDNGEE
jgi:hypothetical protein